MDFLLVVHSKYKKNLFVQHILNKYSVHVLFYQTLDLETISLDKIIQYIHHTKPKYIVIDAYEDLYQPLQSIFFKRLFLVKFEDQKVEEYQDKVNLIFFNKYEAWTLQKMYPDLCDKIYCFEDFKIRYNKLDRTILFVVQPTSAMQMFLHKYSLETQKILISKLQMFFTNTEKYSFDYAIKILVGLSDEIHENIAILYESLEYYVNILKDFNAIKEKKYYQVSMHAFQCEFLPYKYTLDTAKKNKLLELCSTRKIIVFPKYESSQIDNFIDDLCQVLFLGSYVFVHEENKVFVESFYFKQVGFYKSCIQIPKLVGQVQINPQTISHNKYRILQFKNTQSKMVDKNFQVFGLEKNEYIAYLKPYMFKDSYKLLNIYMDNQKELKFKVPTLGYEEGMEVKDRIVSNNQELIEILSKEQADKLCFFDRKNINLGISKYLLAADIYYYSCDLSDFDINKMQQENETYVTSSISLFEYFQSQKLKCNLEISYHDYNIQSMPSKEIATYLYMYNNEKEYKRIYENESISESSKQKLSEYVSEQSSATYLICHDISDHYEIKNLLNFDNINYTILVNSMIENHLNTKLSFLSSVVDNFDIYGNETFLYSIMDNIHAFCAYKNDFKTIEDFLYTIGQYKFFICPPVLDHHNLSLLFTIMVSLKKTYVIIPESLKAGILKIGYDSDCFSFYDSNIDIVNILTQLKEEVLRRKAIEKYLFEISRKKIL